MSAGVQAKVDENLPRQITSILGAQGYDAVTVAHQGLQGTSDDVLWAHVQNERRWLITADKTFADLRNPPGSHAGVILLRPREENRRAYLALAAVTLEKLDLEKISGAVVVATDLGIRVRHAPRS